jgi:hypothetical protein
MIYGEAYVVYHKVRALRGVDQSEFDDILRSSFLFSHARSLIAEYIITFHIPDFSILFDTMMQYESACAW